MYEYILAAFVVRQESIALFCIKPLYCTLTGTSIQKICSAGSDKKNHICLQIIRPKYVMTYNICEINVLLRKPVQYTILISKSQDIPSENRSTNTNLLLF